MPKHINLLICKYLNGTISDREEKELFEFLSSHKDAYQKFKTIAENNDLAVRYREYAAIDTQAAMQRFLEKQSDSNSMSNGNKHKALLSSSLFKCAAAILILIFAGATWWYVQYTKVTPPEIPEAVQFAMQQSIRSGKADAVIEEDIDASKMSDGKSIVSNENQNNVAGSGQQERYHAHTSDPTSSHAHPSLSMEQLQAARRITTLHDKEFWITLNDGTLVHLNYNTRLVYPEHFGRGNRNVILDGEAYFMVSEDKSRPFVVHTPNGDIKVYGTEFNVNTRDEASNIQGEKQTSVVLVKGSISVTPNGGVEQIMKPHQKLSIISSQSSPGNYQLSVNNVDVTPYIAWNTGEFAFSDVPLDIILSTMRNWYHIDIELANRDAGKLLFTGTIDRYGSPTTILKSISKVTGLTIIQSGNHYTIK